MGDFEDEKCYSIESTCCTSFLQYFHDLHCRQTRAELKAFDADFKTKIDDARKEIEKVLCP